MAISTNDTKEGRRVTPWRDARGREIAEGDYLRFGRHRGAWVCYAQGKNLTEDERWHLDFVMLPIPSTVTYLRDVLTDERVFIVSRSTTLEQEYKKLFRWLERNNVDA